ncbi:MAG: peptide-methionine (S)-S-oxide reductase MsrA [Bacteroidetes bacterium]|nr:peptide-methionine (S)-S-oxide reductase MsrA [Bacteroidota bacterium]
MESTIAPQSLENANIDTITLGAGCFWCVEAVFQRLKGVVTVMPGYANGHTPRPTYQQVCSGKTGHVEVAQIVFDTIDVKIWDILEVFWAIHDPTQIDRQGNDVGTQYRSGIYFRNQYQEHIARQSKELVGKSGIWPSPLATEIVALSSFYPAENYHHNYYLNNLDQGYCRVVISPKIEKLKKLFADRLK